MAPEGPPASAEEQGPDRQSSPGSLKRLKGLRDGGEIGSVFVPVRPWDRRVRAWDGAHRGGHGCGGRGGAANLCNGSLHHAISSRCLPGAARARREP
jgi:hypothetical protein